MLTPLLAFASSFLVAATEPPAQPEAAPDCAAKTAPNRQAIEPAEGQAVRVAGDLEAKVVKTDQGHFTFGRSAITTPLPAGYPDPTPPGAIDIKRYPSVRRAEVTGSTTPDIGMNIAFFPLFNHIKSRDIAMTSPVEMNYSGIDRNPPEGGDVVPENWTMSFLYRTADLGPTGVDPKRSQVKIVDVPPVTVLAIGIRGSYAFSRVRKEWAVLERWLSEHPEWDAAGEPRALYYNGPEMRSSDKWAEVQLPIKPVTPRKTESPAEGTTTSPTPAAPQSGS